MKWLLVPLLVISGACRKEKGIWDELTPAEQEAVRERARASCLRDSAETYADFRDASRGVFSSTAWQRNDAWRHQLKNGDTVETTHDVQVWKQTPTALYLVVTRTIGSASPETFFLRITDVANDDMIADLQRQVCLGQVRASGTGPITVTADYTTTVTDGTRKTTDTYTFNRSLFAYAATAWHVTRKIEARNAAGTVTSTTNLTSTFAARTDATALSTDPTTYGSHFCDVVEPTADTTDPELRYKVPYVVPEPAGCASTLPGDWDLAL